MLELSVICLASAALLYPGGRSPFSQVTSWFWRHNHVYDTAKFNCTLRVEPGPLHLQKVSFCWWFLGTKKFFRTFLFISWKVSWMGSCPGVTTPLIPFHIHLLFNFFSISAQALALKYNFLVLFLSSNYKFCIYLALLDPFHYRPIQQ